MPARHQRSRKAGARLPKGVKVVTRPGRWGNPFETAAQFRAWMERLTDGAPLPALDSAEARAMAWIASNVGQLAGLDLACWCALNADCHADVLLEYANRPPQSVKCPHCGLYGLMRDVRAFGVCKEHLFGDGSIELETTNLHFSTPKLVRCLECGEIRTDVKWPT